MTYEFSIESYHELVTCFMVDHFILNVLVLKFSPINLPLKLYFSFSKVHGLTPMRDSAPQTPLGVSPQTPKVGRTRRGFSRPPPLLPKKEERRDEKRGKKEKKRREKGEKEKGKS